MTQAVALFIQQSAQFNNPLFCRCRVFEPVIDIALVVLCGPQHPLALADRHQRL